MRDETVMVAFSGGPSSLYVSLLAPPPPRPHARSRTLANAHARVCAHTRALLELLHANIHEDNSGRRFNIRVVAVHVDESAVVPYPVRSPAHGSSVPALRPRPAPTQLPPSSRPGPSLPAPAPHPSHAHIHVQDGALDALRARVDAFGFAWSCIPLEAVYTSDADAPARARAELGAALAAMRTITAREDLVRQLRTHLLLDHARRGGYAKVLVGDNATRLAVHTLAETGRGRAAVLPLSIAFAQVHPAAAAAAVVTTLRPMREMLSKEVGLYLHFANQTPVVLPTLTTKSPSARASIDHLTEGARR